MKQNCKKSCKVCQGEYIKKCICREKMPSITMRFPKLFSQTKYWAGDNLSLPRSLNVELKRNMPRHTQTFRTREVKTGKKKDERNVLECSLLSFYLSATEIVITSQKNYRPCDSNDANFQLGNYFFTSMLSLCLISAQLCVEMTSYLKQIDQKNPKNM